MTAQELKNSILSLAIQGKLVEQHIDEGTPEKLHEQKNFVQHEKKSVSDELNYDSLDFDIPDSWAMVELNQLFDFVDYRGKTPTKISHGVFLITATNIKKGIMDYSRKEYISRNEYISRQSRGITSKGDLLFTTEAPMGNAAICDLEECSCGQRIITFKEIKKETASLKLYMYFILSPQFQKQLLDNCTGTTAKGIKAAKLKRLLLPYPPLPEQKRIVAKIEELLPFIERYDKSEKRLLELNEKFPDELRKSILQQAVQGKLTEQDPHDEPASELLKRIKAEKARLIKEGKIKKEKPLPPISDDEIPFDIPDGWKWVKLNEVARVTGGYAFKSTDYSEKGVRVIRISDFNEKGLVNNRMVRHRFENFLEMFLIEEKNILLCMTGGTVGKSLMIEKIEEPMMTNQRVATIKINKEILPEFINIVILSPNIQNIIRISKNSTNDNISMDTIKNFPIPVPPLREQKHIVERVTGFLSACNIMQ